MSEELLAAAKRRFYTELMENDLLAGLVAKAAESLAGDLPNFMGEPWLPEGDTIGLRLSSLKREQEGGLTLGVGLYACFRLIIVSSVKSDKTLLVIDDVMINGSDELMAVEATDEEKREAARKFVQLWQAFRHAIREFETYINPVTYTFTVLPSSCQ